MSSDNINIVGDVSGDSNRILQIYAPGAHELTPEIFVRFDDAVPFSVEWLLFSQRSVPLIGRDEEYQEMVQFLDDSRQFAWWALTGGGGHGKSRFGLEFLQNLPEGWEGGFLRSHNLTARDTAAWQPRCNMLWIIDDAAAAGPELGKILGNWASMHSEGPYRLRLLLLERGYSDDDGWWAELTKEFSPRAAVINRMLFKKPLGLAPLGALTDTFLAKLYDQLDADASTRLESALAAMGNEKVLNYSQGGNPLLLMLLAAELLSEEDALGVNVDSGTLAERYFIRELDQLKVRCDAAQVRFGVMLDLLFLTTSCFPINLLLEHDTLFLYRGEEAIVFVDADGQKRFPTVAEARGIGIEVDERKQPMLDALNAILQIDDVQAYLSVLNETGLVARRYAIQPDLIAAALFNLAFNSPETSTNLKRRRGEFNVDRLSRLIYGAIKLSDQEAWSVWARLSDSTLTVFVGYLRELGNSIRWPMLVTRELNRRRNSKVPLVLDRLFAPNKVHDDAPEVGHYFKSLSEAIAQESLEDSVVAALADSPHCWTAPYIDSLLELTLIEQLRLGIVICEISDAVILERLTNLDNFLHCIQAAIATASIRRREGKLSDAETVVLNRLVEALFDFATIHVWPTLVRVDDRNYTIVYQVFARVLATATFLVANQLRGREETEATRSKALLGLDLARNALAIAPSSGDLIYVDRNAAILRAHDIEKPAKIAELYKQVLDATQLYVDAEGYTGVIYDLLHLSAARSAPKLLETVLTFLDAAPPEMVLGEKLISGVLDILMEFAESDPQSGAESNPEQAARLAPLLLRYFAEHIRETEDADAADAIAHLVFLIASLAKTPKQQEEFARILADIHASLAEKPPSKVFLHGILKGAAAANHIFSKRKSPSEELIPFTTRSQTWAKTDLESVVMNDAERSRLEQLSSLTLSLTAYTLNGAPVSHTDFLVEVVEEFDGNDLPAVQAFGHMLIGRILKRSAAEAGVNVSEVPPFD